jgi:hypothetical protein
MNEPDGITWVGRSRTTLTNLPPATRPDVARRFAAHTYRTDPWRGDRYPTLLLRDIDRYWDGWAAREEATTPTGLAAMAVGGYALGWQDRDAAPDAAPAPSPDDRGGAGGLTFAAGWFGGFLTCLIIVVLGAALMSLRVV